MPSIRSGACAVALLLLLTACGGSDEAEGAGGTTTVTFGSPGSASDAGFYLADARGYFAALGIETEYQQVAGGGDLIPLLSTGRLDVGGLSLNSGLINAVLSGNDLQLVADKGSYTDGSTPSYGALLVRPDQAEEITGPEDLEGRSIAVGSEGSSLDIALTTYLDSGGLTTDDVMITTLGQSERVIALQEQAVDVAFVFEPFLTQALTSGAGVVLADGGDMAPEQQVAGMVFGGEFPASNPDAAQDFVSAYLCGVQDYNGAVLEDEDTDAVLEIVAEATGDTVESLRESVPIGLRSDGALNLDDIQLTIDGLAEKGLANEALPVDDLVNTDYLDNARSCDEIREMAAEGS